MTFHQSMGLCLEVLHCLATAEQVYYLIFTK